MGKESALRTLDDHCRQQSVRVGEELAGSAPESVQVWLLLEDCDPWGARPPKESRLPETVRAKLESWKRSVKGFRAHLIRRPDRKGASQRVLFINLLGAASSRLLKLELDGPEALLELDLEGVIAGKVPVPVVDRPHYFVCTHGTRDPCCAKWGVPLFGRLQEEVGEEVWQMSHLGGHRFAPTLLASPSGNVYGRVELSQVSALIEAEKRGGAFVPCLRGNSRLARPAQLVAIRLRQRGCQGRLLLRSATEVADKGWRVLMEHDGTVFEFELERRWSEDIACAGSCGDVREAKPRWEVLAERVHS